MMQVKQKSLSEEFFSPSGKEHQQLLAEWQSRKRRLDRPFKNRIKQVSHNLISSEIKRELQIKYFGWIIKNN